MDSIIGNPPCLIFLVVLALFCMVDIRFRLEGTGKRVKWRISVTVKAKLEVAARHINDWLSRIFGKK